MLGRWREQEVWRTQEVNRSWVNTDPTVSLRGMFLVTSHMGPEGQDTGSEGS